MGRLDQFLHKGDVALVDRATQDAAKAFRFSRLTVADVRDVPCPKRAAFVQRYIQRMADERLDIASKRDRVVAKLRAAERDPALILKALDKLNDAHAFLGNRIREARITRKHAERACRIRK